MGKKISQREAAILKNTWVLSNEDRSKLDHFFLLHDTWQNLAEDFYIDEQEVKRFLKHDGREYEVVLMQPVRQLQAAKELGLSFRVNLARSMRVVLIREWHENAQHETKEVVSNE